MKTGVEADRARPLWRYAAAIFLGAALLFLMEPVAAKRILPLLGGSAAVWAACLVFFQATLLAGYAAAHWLVTRVTVRRQRAVYLGCIGVSIVQLAVASRVDLHADTTHPIASVLAMLSVLIGIPFVTLAATGPLLQSWYARSTTASPYRLYVVSNIGSMLGLVAYPWLIEPTTSLHAQFAGLAVGMIAVAAAAVVIGATLAVDSGNAPEADARSHGDVRDPVRTRLLWILLAACGSFLLSAVTSYVSQNVATIPLLWIIPLVAYLLSFIVAFSDERWHPRPVVVALGVVGLVACAYRLYRGDLKTLVPVTVAIHCTALFAICLFCHDELYHRRPDARRLTSFYLHLAAGGALGAFLAGVAAPMVLPGNYDLAIGLVFAATLGVVCTWRDGALARIVALMATGFMVALVHRQWRIDHGAIIYRERNFYGTLKVDQGSDEQVHATIRSLQHGIIEHGRQVFRVDLVDQPTTYYARDSGVGLAIQLCCGTEPRRVGVIGLGTGTLAAYGRPGDVIRFYDLNPAVEPIARRLFTYLQQSKGQVEVVDGDARVSMANEPPQRYDVIAIDAFSGDAIPVHLITREALALYRRHLAPGGVIAFHVSNRYLRLAAVVKQLADDANLTAIDIDSSEDLSRAVFSSEWVLVTDNAAVISALELSEDRKEIEIPQGLRVWTDDYNSLLPILRVTRAR